MLVVDRGWVPPGLDGSVDVTPPAAPEGTITLTARLRHDEPASNRDAPAGQVQAISAEQVLAAGGVEGDTYEAYVAMTAEDPSVEPVPGTLALPSTDPGSHLSYAFQWGPSPSAASSRSAWPPAGSCRTGAPLERPTCPRLRHHP